MNETILVTEYNLNEIAEKIDPRKFVATIQSLHDYLVSAGKPLYSKKLKRKVVIKKWSLEKDPERENVVLLKEWVV